MAYDSAYFRRKRDRIVTQAVDKVTKKYGREISEELERGLNKKELDSDFRRVYGEVKANHPGLDEDHIEERVKRTISENILAGQYQTAGKAKKFLRKLKQYGGREHELGGLGFYLTHPVRGLSKLLGREEDTESKKEALRKISREAPRQEVKDQAKKVLEDLGWESTLRDLYEGRIWGKGKYLRAENKLRKRERKDTRDLVGIVKDSIAIVAFVGAVAFIANAGGSPFALTGSAVLEKPLVLGDGLVIGMFLFLIALATKLTSED